MDAGAVLDFRMAWLGLPLRWRMFIREWDPPYRFVDVQVNGPYARWTPISTLETGGDMARGPRDVPAAGGPLGARGACVSVRPQGCRARGRFGSSG